jgi:hypothetical protein
VRTIGAARIAQRPSQRPSKASRVTPEHRRMLPDAD